jgi:hypothetical protein
MTLVAAVCDDPSKQELLPQVVLLSKRLVTKAVFDALQARLPPNVIVWRAGKAWMTNGLMEFYAKLLGKRLAPLKDTHRIIVYADVFKAHMCTAALRAMGHHSLWHCFIPGKMAFAVQPCDTHLFAAFKDRLGKECQRRVCEPNATGKLSWTSLVESVSVVVGELLTAKDWGKAFRDTGLAQVQMDTSARVKDKVHWEHSDVNVGNACPGLEHFRAIFPNKFAVPFEALFLGLLLRERVDRPRRCAKALPESPVYLDVECVLVVPEAHLAQLVFPTKRHHLYHGQCRRRLER